MTVNHPSETVMVQLHLSPPDVDGSSIGRASDCDSGGCEFDSHPSTQKNQKKLNKHLTFSRILDIMELNNERKTSF